MRDCHFTRQWMHCASWLLCVLLLLTPSMAFALNSTALQFAVDQGLDVSDCRIQPLTFAEDASGTLYTSVQVDEGQFWTLELTRHSMRAEDFRVLVDNGVEQVEVAPPAVHTWRGTVLQTGDAVRASFHNGQFRATIFGMASAYGIQPIADAGVTGLAPNLHAFYDSQDSTLQGYTCGVDDTNILGGIEDVGGGAQPFGGPLFVCEIGLDADFEFYQDNFSSVSSTVVSMESVMNAVENIYEAQCDITYEITTIIVRTTSGAPYTTASPGGLLDQFRNHWNSNPQTNIRSDVAHLFTGKNLSGTTIGIASLGVICSTSNQYGLSESSFSPNFNSRMALTAHELGHNWAAFHCNGQGGCRIMCSGLGGCAGFPPYNFNGGSVSSIVNHRLSRTCLTTAATPAPLPFIEEFSSQTLNLGVWSYNKGGAVVTTAVGEPSGTFSLNLDAIGNQDFQDDEIRTTEIMMAGAFQPTLSYYTQHRGVEAGEELIVEFRASNLQWEEINRITSNGTDQTSFVQHSHTLGAGALHNGFRLRFRTEVNNFNDDWFIDSITITEGVFIPDPPTLNFVIPASSNIEGGEAISIQGTDFQGDALVTMGGVPLVNQQFINATEIQGTIPPALNPGFVDVAIGQSSGVDVVPDAFRYVNDKLIIQSKQVTPGQTVTVDVIADHESDLGGYSYGVDFDPNQLEVLDLPLTGTLAEGADFIAPTLNNDNTPDGGWFTIGVLFDLNPPLDFFIAAGNDHVIGKIILDVNPSAPVGELLELQLRDDLNTPAVDLTFGLQSGAALTPARVNGFLEVIAGVTFLRGDANGSLTVDISDAILNLDYQFAMGSVQCLDSLDVNDDGQVNIGDAISLLGYLFAMEAPPAAPFPNPGVDTTPDAIDCVPAP